MTRRRQARLAAASRTRRERRERSHRRAVRWLAPLVLWAGAVSTLSSSSWADDPSSEEAPTEAQPEEDDTARARAAFDEGSALAKKMLWAEALGRFEVSAKLRPHAGTTYNMAICHRALGQYTVARAVFSRALRDNAEAGGGELAQSTVENINGFLAEVERVLATVTVTLDPPSAAITVDGRPLERMTTTTGPPVLVAGTLPVGPGGKPPARKFKLVVDPGMHVIVIERAGFSDAVVRHQVTPGSKTTLALKLERLPSLLHVEANEPRAAVAVDGVDVGLAPVTLQRPAGPYEVVVEKRGFDPYRANVTLHAAQRLDLMARLQPTTIGLHERWWFWTALGATLASAVVVTYFVTRPEPERPPLDGGGLGWTIRVP